MTTEIEERNSSNALLLINDTVSCLMQGNQSHIVSYDVAKIFGKRHDNVLRDIREIGCSSDFYQRNFEESYNIAEMPNGGFRKYPFYRMTRAGFMVLVMGFTGRKAFTFKLAIIKAFNEMEAAIKYQRRLSYTAEALRDAATLIELSKLQHSTLSSNLRNHNI
ncbi:Rha family transcriptional regulator [Cloacibacillus evryensis]|uniref:Rha family transcriptional regulator n=1 Tax=Cloacibacillus evryensis TaxID=508460 RepID=UPI00241E9D4F|nr:Rha family transcriptional regulator [Cloacibacillus evryensis]